MLTVEYCLHRLEDICGNPILLPSGLGLEITNAWDRRFIADVSQHVANGSAISTSQSSIVLKLIERYQDHLVADGTAKSSIDQLLLMPQYKKPPYQSVELPREVRYAGDNKLVFRCKYNQAVVDSIKALKSDRLFNTYNYPAFIREHKLWLVEVNGRNYETVMDVIKRHKFHFDDDVANYFLEIENTKDQPSNIVADEETIEVNVRNDAFLQNWLNALQALAE